MGKSRQSFVGIVFAIIFLLIPIIVGSVVDVYDMGDGYYKFIQWEWTTPAPGATPIQKILREEVVTWGRLEGEKARIEAKATVVAKRYQEINWMMDHMPSPIPTPTPTPVPTPTPTPTPP